MSDKIRVNFLVNGQGVGKPTEISAEDYIHFMIGLRDGDNHALACFISGKFMRNKDVPENAVSMSKAVGAPMWVFDIDRAVANHEDTKLFQAIDGRTYGISDSDTDNHDSFDDDDDEEEDDEEEVTSTVSKVTKTRKKSKSSNTTRSAQDTSKEDEAMDSLMKVAVKGEVISSILSKIFWLVLLLAVLWLIF